MKQVAQVTKVVPDWPLFGYGFQELNTLLGFADKKLCEALMVEAAQSCDRKSRMVAAMHKHTPISAVVFLQDDKDPMIAEVAALRVKLAREAEDGNNT